MSSPALAGQVPPAKSKPRKGLGYRMGLALVILLVGAGVFVFAAAIVDPAALSPHQPLPPPARLTGSWSGTYHGADVSGNPAVSLVLLQPDAYEYSGVVTMATPAGTMTQQIAGDELAGVGSVPAGGLFPTGGHIFLAHDRQHISLEWKDAQGVPIVGDLTKVTTNPSTARVWDGTYQIHIVPGGTCGPGNFNPQLSVVNNVVRIDSGAAIDANGHAVSVYQGSVTITTTLDFSAAADGTLHVKGSTIQHPGTSSCFFEGTKG